MTSLTVVSLAEDEDIRKRIRQLAFLLGIAVRETVPEHEPLDLCREVSVICADLEGLKKIPERKRKEICSRRKVILMSRRGDSVRELSLYRGYIQEYVFYPSCPLEFQKLICRCVPVEFWEQRTMLLGKLMIDRYRREVRWKGIPLDLKGYDYDVLLILAERIGQVVPREQINQLLPQRKRSSLRHVDTHIKQIRKAVGQRDMIQCVRSIGYRIPVVALKDHNL